MRNPFDHVKEILEKKNNLIVDKESEDEYVPFIVNRALSFHKDCIFPANEMNRIHFLDKKLQNDFLLNFIRGYKRPYRKWEKPEKNDDIDCIKILFGFSDSKAREALKILTKDQLKNLKKKTEIGGLSK